MVSVFFFRLKGFYKYAIVTNLLVVANTDYLGWEDFLIKIHCNVGVLMLKSDLFIGVHLEKKIASSHFILRPYGSSE